MLTPFPFSDLHTWYLKNGRSTLPWRNYDFDEKTLGYRVWLAETMLQQTQVERVKSYFENILEAFPTVEDLAECSYDDFFPYYKGLGYYSRARNMLAAAAQVRDEFGGVFPRETEQLITLKGVGPYTAEAIRAFAYNKPTLSFDTNLEKIFSRYYHGNKFQKLTKDEKEELLNQMQSFCFSCKTSLLNPLPSKGKGAAISSSPGGEELRGGIARDINNALMDYGATVSLNNISGIDWDNYPLPSSQFYKTRGQLEPVKEKKKSTFPNKQAYVIALLHENHKKYFSPPNTSILNSFSCQEKETTKSGSDCDFISPAGDKGETERSDNFEVEATQNGERCLEEKKAAGFTPFFIGKNTGNPRAMTQEYFLQKHGLEVSVRPPEVKSYNQNEVPYMVCYVQIQSGKHDFTEFEGLKVRGFEEGYVEELEFGELFILNKN